MASRTGWPPLETLTLAWSLGMLAAAPTVTCGETPPWEIWSDLRMIAELPVRTQVGLRSSHCPDGCRFDRHSDGDSRFLYVDGEEGVIFDEPGAGAITRIWATMGEGGLSVPRDPDIGVRIYVDGQTTPVVDAPLPALFDGSLPPFEPPLVGNRLLSSGGNFSYVPIPYRAGCRIALVGAEKKRIWFQIGFHRRATPDGIESFTGAEDLTHWTALMDSLGDDPWPFSEAGLAPGTTTDTMMLALPPRHTATVAQLTGPDVLTALRVHAPPEDLGSVEIQIAFDGEERVRMPLTDFFAVGRDLATPTRSMLFGLASDGFLYSYVPMPFFASAEIRLRHLGAPTSGTISLEIEVRRENRPPPAQSGLFGAQLRVNDPTTLGVDAPLLVLTGRGKWFGLFSDLASIATFNRQYLEGDERVYLDGAPHPAIYGTGVEDFFNGGFYFDQGAFSLALHGSPYHIAPAMAGDDDVTAAYRWMPTDAITFENEIRAGVEVGPTGDRQMRARTVAYYYLRAPARLDVTDVLDLNDAASRTAHGHEIPGEHTSVMVDSFFEGEPPLVPHAALSFERPPGDEIFTLRPNDGDTLMRLRRRYDSLFAGQPADVYVNGVLAARFPVTFPNAFRRWQEVEVDLPPTVTPDANGNLLVRVAALPAPGDLPAGTFTSGRYELLSGRSVHTLDFASDGQRFVDEAGSFIAAGPASVGGFIQLLAVGASGYDGFVAEGDGTLGDDVVVATSFFGENVPLDSADGSFSANPVASSIEVGEIFVLRFFTAPSPDYDAGLVPTSGYVGLADMADHTIGSPSGAGPLIATSGGYDQWLFDAEWLAGAMTPIVLLHFAVE